MASGGRDEIRMLQDCDVAADAFDPLRIFGNSRSQSIVARVGHY
jgi:hypothetical protein